jgi:hypothetical protein
LDGAGRYRLRRCQSWPCEACDSYPSRRTSRKQQTAPADLSAWKHAFTAWAIFSLYFSMFAHTFRPSPAD